MNDPHREGADRATVAALLLMGAALLLIVHLHLLMALLSGLAAFTLYRALLRALTARMSTGRAHVIGLALVVLLLAAGIATTVEGLGQLSEASSSGGLPRLLQISADTLDSLRTTLPPWLASRLPESSASVHDTVTQWMRSHASDVRLWGHHTLRGAAYILAGLVIGFLASLAPQDTGPVAPIFLRAWRERLSQLAQAFTDIVSSQLRIAALNTVFTAIYLLAVLPLFGWHVPLANTLVAVTFFAGLVPVVGNLASNTAIVLASLTLSPWLGAVSLGFLVGIHKLEYFLNARIVGSRIRVRTYELLAAMLAMEAAFGLAGVVAAPVYYAWITRELRQLRVI
ncbi:MAG: AI-2E family transporter [Burkholderiales bacterium]|nr:AI-2E family transporter [Burkholderiales bacterium]